MHRLFLSIVALLCVAIGILPAADAVAKKPRKERDLRPGWMQDNDCLRKDEGGEGDDEEELEPEEPVGLHFDKARELMQAKVLATPEVLLFKVAAINESNQPVSAWVEASICGFQETCVVAGGDFRLFGRRGPIEPAESRYVVFETAEKVGFGTHRVTFALFDETGQVRDWWIGEPIQVGYSDVRVDDIIYPGHEASDKSKVKLRADEPATFSVVVSNFGEAPEAVTAIFAIDGGGEFTCGVELYTDPVRIEPEQQGVVLSKEWEKPTRGRHVMTVLLKDQKGSVIYENYGIPFEFE